MCQQGAASAIRSVLSMGTMALAEQPGAGSAEAHSASKGDQRTVGFMLLDEDLGRGVDDLGVGLNARQRRNR